MFNRKPFNEKYLFTRKYCNFACVINCTRKLTRMCACACACDRTRLREQYAFSSVASERVNVSWALFIFACLPLPKHDYMAYKINQYPSSKCMSYQ